MKNLSRIKDGETVIIFQVAGCEPLRCDFNELSLEMQKKCGIHGMNAKIGDRAAGEKGAEADASIREAWNMLVSGKWTERVKQAGEKISVSRIKDALSKLSDAEREEALAIFRKMGTAI